MRHLAAVWAALLLVGAGAGCGAQDVLLGAQRGYLLTAQDALALPGEEVALAARLQAGDFLRDRPGQVIRFTRDGQPVEAAETGVEGIASVPFTPPATGDYTFQAEVSPVGLPDEPPDPAPLLVACRQAEAPMAVVDMDRTLVASGFEQVLVGNPEPMPDSAAVMKRIAGQMTIVYLTHRPEYFGPKSKAWLTDHGYPRGPVLLSTVGGFLKGSRQYKTEAIRRLQQRFKALRIGVGDKVSDAQAYVDTGLRAFLIVQPPEDATAEQLREMADAIHPLPDDVQVVTSWRQIEQAVFEGASYPRSALEQTLRDRATALEEAAADQ